jgi:hypothetical protein
MITVSPLSSIFRPCYELVLFFINQSIFWRLSANKKSSDYLLIRIRISFTNFISLFLCFRENQSFRIIKFVATVMTFIFWFLSVSNRNLNTFTFWTNFNKISTHLKKYIIRSSNTFFFFLYQNFIPDFDIVTTLIRKSVWEIIDN